MTETKYFQKLLSAGNRAFLSECLQTSTTKCSSRRARGSTKIHRHQRIQSRNLASAAKASLLTTKTRNDVIECKRGGRMNNYHSIALEDPSQVGCPDNGPGRNLKEQMAEIAVAIKENVLTAMSQPRATASEDCRSDVKPYDRIPGPKGIPLLGSALEYTMFGKFSPKEYHKALSHRHNKYGKIFREKILNEEFLYISCPNDIRLLAQNEGRAPHRPSLEPMVKSREQVGVPVGITAMQGEEWLRNRNAMNSAISLPKEVKKYSKAQRYVAKDLIAHMKEARDIKTGEVPQFEQVLIRWALESIAVVLLDTRLGLLAPGKKEIDPAAEGLRKCMGIFFDYGARLTFGIPFWKLWNTKDWKIYCKSQKDEFKYAGHYVEKKLKELNIKAIAESKSPDAIPSGCPMHRHGNKKSKSTENVSCLLERVMNHSELSKEEALTVCLELLAGGIDTTSTAAIFTFYQLAENPQHQEKLRELLQEEEGGDKNVDEYDRERSAFSKYLKACVWESLRLNPLTFANMRKTEKDLVFSGYSVPAGTTVRFTTHLMNLTNEEYFRDANEFIPQRWIDRKSTHRCTKQFVFTPFGHGPRQCPGRRVAEQELDLLFREILSNFKVDYKHEKIGTKVRLFNCADKPAQFEFVPLK